MLIIMLKEMVSALSRCYLPGREIYTGPTDEGGGGHAAAVEKRLLTG